MGFSEMDTVPKLSRYDTVRIQFSSILHQATAESGTQCKHFGKYRLQNLFKRPQTSVETESMWFLFGKA